MAMKKQLDSRKAWLYDNVLNKMAPSTVLLLLGYLFLFFFLLLFYKFDPGTHPTSSNRFITSRHSLSH
ncbi:hypothetical protein LZ32DRAFT_321666 [Colletotrichum eremochloae]|nr:hypothetical protein LZ32DRAFT_321666 [Colletotrichum eremochloae]